MSLPEVNLPRTSVHNRKSIESVEMFLDTSNSHFRENSGHTLEGQVETRLSARLHSDARFSQSGQRLSCWTPHLFTSLVAATDLFVQLLPTLLRTKRKTTRYFDECAQKHFNNWCSHKQEKLAKKLLQRATTVEEDTIIEDFPL